MKRFHFKLERILGLRIHKEKEWEIKLGEITGESIAIKQKIKKRITDKRTALKKQAYFISSDKNFLYSTDLYMKRLDIEIDNLEDQLEIVEIEREKIKIKYLEVSKERKVLDKVKEKRELEFHKKQLLEEMKNIDDINTGMAVRKRNQRKVTV